MDKAWYILYYLPKSFKSEKDQEYINFLWDSFVTNYESGKYQFAYLAYHMLFMCFVYFIVWRIKNSMPEDFQKALVGFQNETEKDFLEASSPFVFHKINESIIFRFLKLLGCDKSKIGKYTKMVKDRNEVAHSNGNIFYNSQEALDEKISDLVKLIDEIHEHSKPIVAKCFENFLLENYDPETREFTDTLDQINEILIQKNYLSDADIAFCADYEVEQLSHSEHYKQISELYESFIENGFFGGKTDIGQE